MKRRWRDGGLDAVPIPGRTEQLWLCGKHVVGGDPEAALARIGAPATLVCLTQRAELVDRYPDYVDWLDQHDGGRALWFPIPDLDAPTSGAVGPFLDQLVGRLDLGDHLLVHCAAGIGRSGTIAVCLLMLLGVARDDALASVAAHRPMAGPEVGSQRDLVDALAESLGFCP